MRDLGDSSGGDARGLERSQANEKLKAARLRAESPTHPGQCLSRQELGELVSAYVYRHYGHTLVCDANWVGKLERGEITWPRTRQREAIRAVLNAPNDEALGFRNRRRSVVRVSSVQRRQLLLGMGAAALSPIAAALASLPPTPVPTRIGATEIQQVNDAARVFSSWDQTYGSGPTRAAVMAQLRWSAGLLDASCPEQLRPELHCAVAYLAHTCGMIAFDAYEHDDARRIFRLALACAEEAGDWHLRAKVFSSMARQAIWVGEPDEGLTFAEHALVRSDRLTATERAMLHTARARALAKMQRVKDARAAVGAADDAFADANPANDPPWMAYYDAAQHAGDTGHALWDLSVHGDTCDAAERLITAVEGHPGAYLRSRAISRTKLASLVMATGDPREAAAIGTTGLSEACSVRSRRLDDDLRDLYRLGEPHDVIVEVAQLRHQIATTLLAS